MLIVAFTAPNTALSNSLILIFLPSASVVTCHHLKARITAYSTSTNLISLFNLTGHWSELIWLLSWAKVLISSFLKAINDGSQLLSLFYIYFVTWRDIYCLSLTLGYHFFPILKLRRIWDQQVLLYDRESVSLLVSRNGNINPIACDYSLLRRLDGHISLDKLDI